MTETKDISVIRRAAALLLAAVCALSAGFLLCRADGREALLPDVFAGITSIYAGIAIAVRSLAPLLICFAAVFVASFTPFRVWVCLSAVVCRGIGAGALICAAMSGKTGAVLSAASDCVCTVCLLAFCAVCSGKVPDTIERGRMSARRIWRSFLSLSGAAVVFSVLGALAVHFI